MKIKDKRLCLGCDSNFYNGNNPFWIKECWHFKDAKVVTRYRIGVHTPCDRKENFTKVQILDCFTQTGSFAYFHGIPDHLTETQKEPLKSLKE